MYAYGRDPTTLVPASGKTIYTCPMHPEVQLEHPGDCPKCGMALEPKTVTAGTDNDENWFRLGHQQRLAAAESEAVIYAKHENTNIYRRVRLRLSRRGFE